MIIWYTALLMAVLLIVGFLMIEVFRKREFADLDRRLSEDVEIAQEKIDSFRNGSFSIDDFKKCSGDGDEDDDDQSMGSLIEIFTPNGKLLFRGGISSLDELPRPRVFPRKELQYISLKDSKNIPARSVMWWYESRDGRFLIRISRSEENIALVTGKLLLVMLLMLPVACGLAVLGGTILIDRMLAPLHKIIEGAKNISAENLDDRLPIENPGDELGQLALVLNDIFSRLADSFKELQRFTSDASHELRTPLTAMRAVGEVALRKKDGGENLRDTVRSMLEEVDRLSLLVDSLLSLSRADKKIVKPELVRTDLSKSIRMAVEFMTVLAEGKKQEFKLEFGEGIFVRVDKDIIHQALVNIIDNAIKYSPVETIIRIRVNRVEKEYFIEISDQGPGIQEIDAKYIFERFYRGDRSRSRNIGGTGLGLSIAKWAVEVCGGYISLAESHDGGTTLRIVFNALE